MFPPFFLNEAEPAFLDHAVAADIVLRGFDDHLLVTKVKKMLDKGFASLGHQPLTPKLSREAITNFWLLIHTADDINGPDGVVFSF